MTTWKPADAPDQGPRLVLWLGVVLGTVLAVLAMMDGVRLRIGGMPAFFGWILGGLIVWLIAMGGAAVAAGLVRRHRKTAGRFAVRHGRRVASTAGRFGRRRGQVLETRATRWAGPRWQARQSLKPGSEAIKEPSTAPAPARAPRVCVACGNPEYGPRQGGGNWGPLVTYREPLFPGWAAEPRLIHKSHFEDESTGFYGRPYEAVPDDSGGHSPDSKSTPATTGGIPMAPPARGTSRITPDRRAQRTAARTGAAVPSEWGPVVAQAADFEAESDEHMLDWMNGQVSGMAAYAEALIEAYETHVGAIGIDPKGLAALHDVADAAAHAAEMMSGAKTTFSQHYELPREFAANGGLMPHDGRWVTGEGD